MKTNKKAFLAMLVGASGAFSVAQAEIFNYTDGNLILGFQATGGQGSQQNVFLDLGKATDFRDNGSRGVLGNIGVTLSSVYGADWYERSDLWFGVIGNLNQQVFSGIGAKAAVNGDPSRTFYLSSAAVSPGAGSVFPAATFNSSALGSAGNNLSGLERVLMPSTDGTGWVAGGEDVLANGLQKEADGAGILVQTLGQHATAWNNSWTKWNPTPGAAFASITGGIQQSFGKGGSATYVDVQRILATNTGAVPTGVIGGGTYETTISISAAGVITSLTSTPSVAPFETWALSFPALNTEAKRLPSADPDQDGLTNLMEFVLNGNPGIASNSIAPALNAAGNNFVFSFNRRVDSVAGTTLRFQYGSDLVGWTDVAIGATGGTVGNATISVVSGGVDSNSVTVTLPKSVAPGGKLFGRLSATQP
jgi:hypothetical protein